MKVNWRSLRAVMPAVTRLNVDREFGWHGTLSPPGFHETDRYFQMEPLGSHGTRLHHAEEFRGWLAWFLKSEAQADEIQQAFQIMNANLKARVEAVR